MKANKSNPASRNIVGSRQKLLMLIVILLMIPLFFVSRNIIVGFTQTKDKNTKLITKQTFDNEPIEIVDFVNSEKPFSLDKTFEQNKDWLKDFTVKLKNKSKKTITYISIELDFPETKSSGNIMAFPLSYGRNPLYQNKTIFPEVENEKPIATQEFVNLTLTENKYAKLKSFIETRHLINDLSKIDIRIVFVLFDDGTAWGTGTYARSDPNNPKKFIPITSSEFGGNK